MQAVAANLPDTVVVNLGRVEFMCSSTLTALITLRDACSAAGSAFVTSDSSPFAARAIEIAGLADHFGLDRRGRTLVDHRELWTGVGGNSTPVGSDHVRGSETGDVVTRRMWSGVVCVAVVALVVASTAPEASAHVTIDTLGDAAKGSFAKLGFSVPNERDDSGTVMLRVQLPPDHPLAFVSVQPKAGWSIETTTRQLDVPVEADGASIDVVVDTITWTATGDTQIGPHQFDSFWISAGLMPTDVDSLSFPTIQTYASGEEVAWIDATPSTGEEPEHPVPTVRLVARAGAPDSDAQPSASDDGADSDGTLAVVALIVGVVATAVGVAALLTGRRRPAA